MAMHDTSLAAVLFSPLLLLLRRRPPSSPLLLLLLRTKAARVGPSSARKKALKTPRSKVVLRPRQEPFLISSSTGDQRLGSSAPRLLPFSVTGTLKGYDQLLNLVLDEAIEFEREQDDPLKLSAKTRQLGLIVCRGTAVMLVSPTEGTEEIQNPFQEADGAQT